MTEYKFIHKILKSEDKLPKKPKTPIKFYHLPFETEQPEPESECWPLPGFINVKEECRCGEGACRKHSTPLYKMGFSNPATYYGNSNQN